MSLQGRLKVYEEEIATFLREYATEHTEENYVGVASLVSHLDDIFDDVEGVTKALANSVGMRIREGVPKRQNLLIGKVLEKLMESGDVQHARLQFIHGHLAGDCKPQTYEGYRFNPKNAQKAV